MHPLFENPADIRVVSSFVIPDLQLFCHSQSQAGFSQRERQAQWGRRCTEYSFGKPVSVVLWDSTTVGVSKAEVHTSKTPRGKGNFIFVNLALDYVAYIKVPVDLDINCTSTIMLTRNKTQAHQSLLNQDASFQQSLRSFSINAI